MNNHTESPLFISVVMSTYNDEKYIGKSIQSILGQSYPYFEFIIVNDGSTDGTLDVINSFKDKRIRVINKQNTGLPDSLNLGIKSAQYEWIARMDSDDYALPDRFKEQIKCIRDGLGVVGGQCLLIDEKDNQIGVSHAPVSPWEIKLCMMLGSSPVFHPTALIRKKAWEEVGGYDLFFSAGQDKDLWYKISSHYRITNSSSYVLCLRKHTNNISVSKRDKQYESGVISQVKHSVGIDRRLTQGEYAKIKEVIKKSVLCGLLNRVNSNPPLKGLSRRWFFLRNKVVRGCITIYFKVRRRHFRSLINVSE